jgi:hypothetical protein
LALEKVSVCLSGSSLSTQYWISTSVLWIYISTDQVNYIEISHKHYWSNKIVHSLSVLLTYILVEKYFIIY